MTVRVNKPSFNLREKLSELTSKFGLKGTELARAETVQDARNLISAGRRNIFINGAMNVDQRNNGASMNATTAAEYSLDRWRTVSSASDKWSVKRVSRADTTPPEGFTHSMKITSLAATTVGTADYYLLQQRIEGNTLPGFGNSQTPITVSFWIRSSLTGTYGGSWQNTGHVQYYPFQFTINNPNTWEYKTITIPGSGNNYIDGNTRSAIFTISLGVGTGYSEPASGGWTSTVAFGADDSIDFVGTNGATMYLTGVQAEVGNNATDFEYRSYGEELALCQRYLFRVTGNSSDETALGCGHVRDTNTIQGYISLPVTMRDHSQTVTENGMGAISGGTNTDISMTSSFDEGVNCIGLNLDADAGSPFTTGRGAVVRLTANTGSFFQVESEI